MVRSKIMRPGANRYAFTDARFWGGEGKVRHLPKNGMQGGLATCNASRYSPKFLVLAISFLMLSRMAWVFCGTMSHVLLRRAIGAVPNAEMMDVSVEKLFRVRHF